MSKENVQNDVIALLESVIGMRKLEGMKKKLTQLFKKLLQKGGDMDDKNYPYSEEDTQDIFAQKESTDSLRTVLTNAIKMQALYSEGKIRYIETSHLVN